MHRTTSTGIDTPEGGELWALMLDAASTFDRLVREQASSPQQAETLLANPVYRAISGLVVGRPGVHGDRAAPRTPRQRRVGSRDRRHAAVTPRHRPARGARPTDRLPQPPRVPGVDDRAADVRQGDECRGVDVPVGGAPARRPADRRGHDGVLPIARQHRARPPAPGRRGVDTAAIGRLHVRRRVEPAVRSDRRIGASRRRLARRRVPVRGRRDQPRSTRLPAALDDDSLRRRRARPARRPAGLVRRPALASRSPSGRNWPRSWNSPATPRSSSWRCATSTSTTSRGSAASPTISSVGDVTRSQRRHRASWTAR